MPPTEGRSARIRVLVVEDDRDTADSLADVLDLFGYQATVAYDGESGLAAAQESRPRAVVCDIGLPGSLDGHAVARRLRQDPATASAFLVALTGFAHAEDEQRALDAGFDAYLAKPPDLDALASLLAGAARRARR
jgi:CheY-like chemotaxis protein